MPDVDVLLRPEARFFYHEVATPVERKTIDSIISVICENPGVDEAIRFSTAYGDTLYNDGTFWILYRCAEQLDDRDHRHRYCGRPGVTAGRYAQPISRSMAATSAAT